MNVESRSFKFGWRKIAIIAIILGIAGYQWYLENDFAGNHAPRQPNRTATDSANSDTRRGSNEDLSENDRSSSATKSATAGPYLKSAGGNDLRSPAGLIYADGRSEHRADHVLKHAEDIPDRAGPHGVFDANDDDVFRLLDEAYELIKNGSQQVRTNPSDDGRTEYVIDMKRAIGFKGGQEGQRQNHPKLFKIKLVLSKDRVITAYPY